MNDQGDHGQNEQQVNQPALQREMRKSPKAKPPLSYSSQATNGTIMNATKAGVCPIATRCLSICAHLRRG
jgi:hypothetical protein